MQAQSYLFACARACVEAHGFYPASPCITLHLQRARPYQWWGAGCWSAAGAMRSPADLMFSEGGVALSEPVDMAAAYPGLWPSHAAAKMAVHRATSVTDPIRELLNGESYRGPLASATYQRVGKGRRIAKAIFDPAMVPPDGLRDWLEARVGPLARFELDPERPSPDPSRSEPAGAPQSKSGSESREHQGNAPPASAGNGAFGSFSDLEYRPDGAGGGSGAVPMPLAEPVRTPPEAVGGPGGCHVLHPRAPRHLLGHL